MKRYWITTAVAAGTLGFSAVTFAQGTTPAPREPHGTTVISPPPSVRAPSERIQERTRDLPGVRGGAANEPGPVVNQPGSTGSGSARAPLVGHEVVDARQRRIGEVQRIVGDRAIILTDQAIGMGGRLVALDISEIGVIGTGGDTKVQTSMTREDIRKLPTFGDR